MDSSFKRLNKIVNSTLFFILFNILIYTYLFMLIFL